MHILCLGINHTTAPVALREQVAFSEDQVRVALSRQVCGQIGGAETEMVIISTCNRIEFYSAVGEISFKEMETILSDACGLSQEQLHLGFYRYVDSNAVQHLLEVAGGLDSLVLGEPQILGQVTRALELARGVGSAGPFLTRVFHAAIHTGKRIRTETVLSRSAASVSSLAAGMCERVVPDLSTAQVVILGAGEMAELAVEALIHRGARHLLVVNRRLERAHGLASRWGADIATFEQLESALVKADILISSTGAPHMLIFPQMVAAAMQQRPARSLVLVDIAVPRDIDPDVITVSNVMLFDIDNLNAHLEQSLAERAAAVPQARAILAEEHAKFMEYMGTLDMLPLISDIHLQAEGIRNALLEKTMRRLPDLTPSERHHIEAMTQALVKKLLAHPTNHLRAEAASPRAPEIASMTRTLFNLPGNQAVQGYSANNSQSTSMVD